MNLIGNRALVTGGSRGIGLAIAEGLAREGANIVINHFQDEAKARREIDRLGRETGNRFLEIGADVGNPDEAAQMVDQATRFLGGLDILVSNAGICKFTPFLEIDRQNWDRHVAVNFSAGFYVSQPCAKIMSGQGAGGRIIFTTSVGAFKSNATQTHYCATKGGLHLLALGMAIELAPHKITVNCIAPGWIHTDINDEQSRDESIVKPWIEWNCPSGRLGKPTDIVGAALFLASKEAEYVTGATLNVDGGWLARL